MDIVIGLVSLVIGAFASYYVLNKKLLTLSEKNIDDHLKRIRKQQTKYEQLHVKEKEIWVQRIEEIKMKRRFSDCHMGSGA